MYAYYCSTCSCTLYGTSAVRLQHTPATMARFSIHHEKEEDENDNNIINNSDQQYYCKDILTQQNQLDNERNRWDIVSRRIPRQVEVIPNDNGWATTTPGGVHLNALSGTSSTAGGQQLEQLVIRRPTSKKLFSRFFIQSLLVILVAWCAKQSSTKRILIERYTYHALYIFSEIYYYLAEGIENASMLFADHFLSDSSSQRCRLNVAETPPKTRFCSSAGMSPTEAWLNDEIVGQERAISMISTALEGWSLDQHSGSINNSPESSNQAQVRSRKPIFFLFAGSAGTGKSHTAFMLSQWLFQNCSATTSPLNRGVLVLHGEDFVDDDSINTSTLDPLFDESKEQKRNDQILNQVQYGVLTPRSRDKLQRRIVNFLKRRQKGRGALIIINGIEKMHSHVLSALSGLLDDARGGSSCLSYYDSRRRKRIGVSSCEAVIIIFTTDIGNERIIRSVRDYGGRDNVPRIVLDTVLRESLSRHWNGRLNIEKLFHIVVPFLPLGHIELEEIVRRDCEKLSNQHKNKIWLRLEVTPTARQRLVGTDYVEYLDLRKKDSNSLLIFSRHGASSIDSGGGPMQVLRSKLRRHLGAHRSDQVAVFDFNINKNEAIIQWCKENIPAALKHERECDISWRGSIDAQ